MLVANKYILFVKYFGWKKGPEIVYFIYRSIDEEVSCYLLVIS
jgi:hypothetical protein